MLTLVLYAFLALIAVGCLYGLASVFLSRSEQIAPAAADRPPWALSDGPMRAQDIVEVRLPVALRGYRFAEADLLLDRLAEELRVRDAEIARLQAAALGSIPAPAPNYNSGTPIADALAVDHGHTDPSVLAADHDADHGAGHGADHDADHGADATRGW